VSAASPHPGVRSLARTQVRIGTDGLPCLASFAGSGRGDGTRVGQLLAADPLPAGDETLAPAEAEAAADAA